MLLLPFVSKVGDLRIRKAKQQCFVLNIKAPNILLIKLFHEQGNVFKSEQELHIEYLISIFKST